VLEINQATLDIFQMRIPKPKFVLMPTPIWDQLFKPLVAGQRWIAAGLFEPAIREKAGMHWTPGDEVLLRLFGKLIEPAFLAVPEEIRLHPRALAAYRRAEGRIPGDAPLVEAPAFMAPPRDRRGLPMHYFPRGSYPAKAVMERAGSLVYTTLSLAGLRPARGPRKAA
jgi:ER-bound oxygenase mpaB/B'/Rubber oxygenase, catalytic domain